MKMIEKKFIVGVAVVVLIIAIIVLSSHINTLETHGISAVNAKNIADERATEINESLKLYSVVGIGNYLDNGECEGWMFKYRSDSHLSERAVIKVWWDGKVESYTDDFSTKSAFIKNWTIDTTEAVRIAKNVQEIKEYLSRFDNPYIERIAIVGENNRTNGCIINIQWMAGSGFVPDNPHTAEIQIDATTGNVLYVNADLTGSSISAQDVCIGFSVVLIAIVAVMVFKKKRGKNGKENPDKEERAYQREEK